MATGDIVQRLEVLNGLRDPETITPSTGNICQQLDYMIEHGGGGGEDGITPEVTITSISGGHNIAFSYGDGDPRNTDVDVMDGTDGQDGTNGTDGTDGYTPVRGTDYWTAQDVSDMEAYCANYIDTELGIIVNGSY